MGKANKYFLGVVMLLQCLVAIAQNEHYQYKSEIIDSQVGWNKLNIPINIYSKINENYSDIRIIGLTKNGDTVEAPYLIKTERKETVNQQINFTILNQSEKAGDYFFTFSLNELTTVNEIKLDFEQKNYDWRVELEASQDQKEWFSILNDYRIVSINNNLTDYTFSTLTFPSSKYAYYRIKVMNPEEKPLMKAPSVFLKTQKEDAIKNVTVSKTTVTRVKDKNISKIDVYLENVVPVSSLKINVLDTMDYYRAFSVKAVTDSIETPNGWHVKANSLTSGILSSLENNEFNVAPEFSDHLIFSISNYDNAPLKFGEIEIGYYPSQIYFRAPEDADYFLHYGNEHSRLPNYDIQKFTDKIPENINEVSIGKEITIEKQAPADHSLLKNKIWLWIAICVIMVVLGWFTLKMMRQE